MARCGYRHLVFLPAGMDHINIPEFEQHGFGIRTITFHYDPRLGICWGADSDTTYYSAVKR